MSREIRFRVWDKLGKCKVFTGYQMFVDEEVVSIDFYNRDVTVSDFGPMGETILKFEDIELMQYTGLKDRNSKDIYEADIVKLFYDVGEPWISRVYFDHRGVRVKEYSEMSPIRGKCEVIGNIWENEELLK